MTCACGRLPVDVGRVAVDVDVRAIAIGVGLGVVWAAAVIVWMVNLGVRRG